MSATSPPRTLLTAARLLDGSGRPPLEGAALLTAADVLVVERDPSRDLEAPRQVLDVYQAGRCVERGVR